MSVTTILFHSACKNLIAGNHVYRTSWYGSLMSIRMDAFNMATWWIGDFDMGSWHPSQDDILATDWAVGDGV